MFTNLVSLITKSLSITNAAQITKVNAKPTSYNPFESSENLNPFMNPAFKGNENYAKNTPVCKAGILQVINGKPNIVGRKLFY